MKKLLGVSLLALVLASCGSVDRRTTSVAPMDPNMLATPQSSTRVTRPQVPDSTKPGVIFSTPVPATVTRTAAPRVATTTSLNPGAKVALNPPHGQPGHDCSIPVGQPLKTTTPLSPVAIRTPAVATATKGLNPPHGQPGHRCDIPVGAPLNSKPVTPATNPLATPGATTGSSAVKNGMNPPHGQPGHRCDIPVGAPLNSTANTPASATSNGSTPDSTTTPAPKTGSPLLPASYPVRLNPPAGTPGHDSTIPVGKPLKG